MRGEELRDFIENVLSVACVKVGDLLEPSVEVTVGVEEFDMVIPPRPSLR